MTQPVPSILLFARCLLQVALPHHQQVLAHLLLLLEVNKVLEESRGKGRGGKGRGRGREKGEGEIPCISDVHNVKLSLSSCIISVESLYESSLSVSSSAMASSKACLARWHARSGEFRIS